jgi:hypothetical protein
MRLRGRMLATPVLWYRHADTGRTLVLVLNNHVGTHEYFTTMRQRVTELEGIWDAAVYAEGIRPAPDTEWEWSTAAERTARGVLRAFYHDRPAAMAASLGWIFQADAGLTGDGWANPDMTDLELIRYAGPDPILEMGRAVTLATDQLGDRADQYFKAMTPVIYRGMTRPHTRLSRTVTRLAPDLYSVLLEFRSALAVTAVRPERNAVMIYGAEHADSLNLGLVNAGWTFTGKRRWLNVGQLPPLHRTLADVFAVAIGTGVDAWRADNLQRA